MQVHLGTKEGELVRGQLLAFGAELRELCAKHRVGISAGHFNDPYVRARTPSGVAIYGVVMDIGEDGSFDISSG